MIKSPHFVKVSVANTANELAEVSESLMAKQSYVSPKYFYDALGSKLFEAITCLEEYYPTRTEASIFQDHQAELAKALPHEAILIDLGAGNCEKAVKLFDVIHPVHYVAIDISVEFLQDALESIQREHPHMDISGVGLDFSRQLLLPEELKLPQDVPKLFFYPGSSISNFTPEESVEFLKRIKVHCDKTPGSGLLIGVDLVKDKATLEAAYDDALGVTAAFNRNALLNINRTLQSNFELRDWSHKAIFNTDQSRIEMHLQANRDLKVNGHGFERKFVQGETIHTENSYKWLESEFESVLKKAGFSQTRAFMDSKSWFSVIWAT